MLFYVKCKGPFKRYPSIHTSQFIILKINNDFQTGFESTLLKSNVSVVDISLVIYGEICYLC